MINTFCCTSVISLTCLIATAAEPHANSGVVPLFDSRTQLEPNTTEDTSDALITRVADRVRDRHAREAEFSAYDHYLSFYWEERTVALEIVDRVAKGGRDITINIRSLSPLNEPNFRCFFRGINTVAEYHHNAIAREVAPNRYTTTISHNSAERRALKLGDVMAFEFSPFLMSPKNGRKNYYGTEILYVVGHGIRPWQGVGERLDSQPLPQHALLGGGTTLSYQYSNEPTQRFNQMASNMAPASAQSFMRGRRLHHTSFGDGSHSEQPNPNFFKQQGKLGPDFVNRSCFACHVNNGRALPPSIGGFAYRTVVKVGSDENASPHYQLGSALQQQSMTEGQGPEAGFLLSGYTRIEGRYGDGTEYSLRKPSYTFHGVAPRYFSVRLSPQLVGLGLLEAISENTIIALADPNDADGDGISGRIQEVRDPQTGEIRLGRFGYKAGQARLSHQIAGALNSDMGITTAIYPALDHPSPNDASVEPEITTDELHDMTRYVATLGVSARRRHSDSETRLGERLFTKSGCAKCHTPRMMTGPYHPLAELRNQNIQPYTDLLLHDMGAGLADNMGEHAATGSEWRTPPLWSIGLTADVSGGTAFLHDGRARTLEEAILWHDGEAKAAMESFRTMLPEDRSALIAFLKSL